MANFNKPICDIIKRVVKPHMMPTYTFYNSGECPPEFEPNEVDDWIDAIFKSDRTMSITTFNNISIPRSILKDAVDAIIKRQNLIDLDYARQELNHIHKSLKVLAIANHSGTGIGKIEIFPSNNSYVALWILKHYPNAKFYDIEQPNMIYVRMDNRKGLTGALIMNFRDVNIR